MLCQNFRSFGSFLAIFWPFLAIFGPFLALFIYKGMCRPGLIPPLALSFAAREPLDRFRSSWYFWKAEIKGYPMVYTRY